MGIGKIVGYFPARRLRIGNEDAALQYIQQFITWDKENRYCSAGGSLDYIQGMKSVTVPILAINGLKDKGGQQIGKKLSEYAGAEALQIKGPHACYIDNPDAFIQAVLRYLKVGDWL